MTVDHVRAAELYRAAAEAGDAPAQDMLSWMLLEGDSIPFDAVEARRWALAAAKQDIAAAMTRLGMIYHNALAVDRDPAAAACIGAKPLHAATPTARRCSARRTCSVPALCVTALPR